MTDTKRVIYSSSCPAFNSCSPNSRCDVVAAVATQQQYETCCFQDECQGILREPEQRSALRQQVHPLTRAGENPRVTESPDCLSLRLTCQPTLLTCSDA